MAACLGETSPTNAPPPSTTARLPPPLRAQPGRGELFIDVGAHRDRRHGELPHRLVRSRGKQPFDRDEADKTVAVADREVYGAGKFAADEALPDLTGRRLWVGARNVRFGSNRGQLRLLLRTALTSSTAAAGSRDSASTIPSSKPPSETVAKAP